MLVDFHTHLHLYRDRTACLCEIAAGRILSVASSMDIPSYRATLDLAARPEARGLVVPSFGIHPHCAAQCLTSVGDDQTIFDALDPLIASSPIIGEIGLDFFWEKEVDPRAQEKVFVHFLERAAEQDKYCVIHTKGAESRILDILSARGFRKIVVHWYHGPETIFRKLADLGCHFTFGCEVRHSQKVRDLLKLAPEDRVLAETDNPGSEIWLGGERDDPGLIGRVIADMGSVLGKSPSEMESLVERNSLAILRDAGITIPGRAGNTPGGEKEAKDEL